jgi:2-polyprenyl-3-methyl-5-hydroxy-6-metoxy-1,4-benzoquinol methylase
MINKSYFVQKLKINNEFRKYSRLDFLKIFIKEKNVLHVGCADYPITDTSSNLHLNLYKFCKKLDGVDLKINDENKKILSVPNGQLFSNWDKLENCYDVILIPEVVEHIGNLQNFLEFLDGYNGTLIFTAPDAYLLMKNFLEISENDFNFQEVVHPDHNYWFTPYTLKNVINKYSKNRQVDELFWIKGSIAAICR